MVRNSHGRFVANDNPLAVITRLNQRKEADRAAARLRQRRANARRAGYAGPLTREELAATVQS